MQNANGSGILSVKNGFLICPYCQRNTIRLKPETEAHELPVFCRNCKNEFFVEITRGRSARRLSP